MIEVVELALSQRPQHLRPGDPIGDPCAGQRDRQRQVAGLSDQPVGLVGKVAGCDADPFRQQHSRCLVAQHVQTFLAGTNVGDHTTIPGRHQQPAPGIKHVEGGRMATRPQVVEDHQRPLASEAPW